MRPSWQIKVELHREQSKLASANGDAFTAAQAKVGELLAELANAEEHEAQGQGGAHDNDPARQRNGGRC